MITTQISAPVVTEKPTILIVDDQITNIQILALCLEMQGYSITYALNARDTLERLRVLQPDLIFLDLCMPDMSGFDLCEKIKTDQACQDIPVIFLTASHDEKNVVSAFEKGAADYVMKPFNVQEMLARVENHIKLRRQSVQLRQAIYKLNTIITHIQDGLLVIDDKETVQFANPAAAHMLNQSMENLLGNFLPQWDPRRSIQRIRIRRLNGQVGFADMTFKLASWEDSPVSIVCLRDVSDYSEFVS